MRGIKELSNGGRFSQSDLDIVYNLFFLGTKVLEYSRISFFPESRADDAREKVPGQIDKRMA